VRGDRTIVAQRIASQDEAHRPFGGVVPELAARAHADRLAPMVQDVLDEAGIALLTLTPSPAQPGRD
jgi:N6-L-threonylcarbamoyladenine synthase